MTGSASTAVYLDAGSRGARVEDNVFTRNGFVENGPGGTTTTFGGLTVRYWGPGREAVAVDGSSDNVIRRNRIVGNSAGGVFLYTNCGENVHTDPANWLDHRYGAEHNLIADNVIVGDGTGVWVASRMGENVYPMDCSDVPYVTGPLKAITLDRARDNDRARQPDRRCRLRRPRSRMTMPRSRGTASCRRAPPTTPSWSGRRTAPVRSPSRCRARSSHATCRRSPVTRARTDGSTVQPSCAKTTTSRFGR